MRCKLGPWLAAMMMVSVMATPDAQAEAGPGGFYANIPDGAFSVVAKSVPSPAKRRSYARRRCPSSGSCAAIRKTS